MSATPTIPLLGLYLTVTPGPDWVMPQPDSSQSLFSFVSQTPVNCGFPGSIFSTPPGVTLFGFYRSPSYQAAAGSVNIDRVVAIVSNHPSFVQPSTYNGGFSTSSQGAFYKIWAAGEDASYIHFTRYFLTGFPGLPPVDVFASIGMTTQTPVFPQSFIGYTAIRAPAVGTLEGPPPEDAIAVFFPPNGIEMGYKYPLSIRLALPANTDMTPEQIDATLVVRRDLTMTSYPF